MKKLNLMWIAALAIVFVACNPETPETVKNYSTVNFEDLTLTEGKWDGSDLSGTPEKEESWGVTITNYYGAYTSGICSFANVYTEEWYSWKGFACSNQTDTTTSGYANQYSVQAMAGAEGSAQFGLVFENGTITCNHAGAKINSMQLCNSVYVYRSLAYAENNCKVLEDGDYFKVIITGKLNGEETNTIEYYLADYRNGKTFINNTWEKVDVTALGEVDQILFSFDGTDKNDYGMLTPGYVCIDNIVFEVAP